MEPSQHRYTLVVYAVEGKDYDPDALVEKVWLAAEREGLDVLQVYLEKDGQLQTMKE